MFLNLHTAFLGGGGDGARKICFLNQKDILFYFYFLNQKDNLIIRTGKTPHCRTIDIKGQNAIDAYAKHQTEKPGKIYSSILDRGME